MKSLASSSAAGAALLAGLAFVAFGPSYLDRLGEALPPLLHLHAALMALWCALLVAQPLLIVAGQRSTHRRLGALAWVLAPAIVMCALSLAWAQTRPAAGAAIEPFRYALLPVQWLSAALFGLCVAQALRRRQQPTWHARWMIGSALALIDPVLARVFAQGLPMPLPAWWGDWGSALMALAIGAVISARQRAVQISARQRAVQISMRQRAVQPGRGIALGVGAAVLAINALGQAAAASATWRGWMDRGFA